MSDIQLLAKEISIRRIIAVNGVSRLESLSVRPKLNDANYFITCGVRHDELVECHRFILGKDLKVLCSYHGIPTFNACVDSMRDGLRRHLVCGPDCRIAFMTFKLLPRARHNVDARFLSTVLDIPLVRSELDSGFPNARSMPEAVGHSLSSPSYTLGDDSHLVPPSTELKEAIIREWQGALCPTKLRRGSCAICAKLVAHSSLEPVNAVDLDLSLLRNDQLPIELCPTDYDYHLYDRALLHARGMHDKWRLGLLDVCEACGNDLSKKKMPKFALCNWLYYGRDRLPPDVQVAFTESSVFERVLVARARSNVLSCRFSTTPTNASDTEPTTDGRGKSFRHTQHGMKGNVVVTPMDLLRLNEYLPPSPDSIRDTLCIIFTGSTQQVTKESLQSRKLHPVLVRKSRIKLLIQFLIAYNPHYGYVSGFKGFSDDYLNRLFSGLGDVGVPDRVEIAQLSDSIASDALNSGYIPRADAPIPVQTPDSDVLMMENVGYTMTDRTPHAYQRMKWDALQRCLDKKPFLNLRRGSNIVPDFSNPCILSWILPHLDPWGIGGFYHPLRTRYISMEEQLAHMLQMDDDYFVKDPEFAFIFYNIIRKKSVSQGLRFSAPISKYRRLVEDILTVDRVQLVQLANKFDSDPTYSPVSESELHLVNLLRTISASSAGVPGSVAQKIVMRNEIRAMIVAYGAPKLFITLTPSDRDNILVQALTSASPDIGDLMRGTALSDWQRNLLATRNPCACAMFFDHVIKGFIEIILRYGRDGGGLYGHCTAYYGTVEAQGRGTLHCHFLIWLTGHPPPNTLQRLVSESPDYRVKLFTWLESIMCADFLGENGRRLGSEAWTKRKEREIRGVGSIHPGALIGPLINNYSSERFWEEYDMYVNQLLVEYHIHEHKPTCFKYLARWEQPTAADCRMGITGEVFPETMFDPETMSIIVKRTHPRMTHFTPIVTFLLKCNSDTKFIGSGAEALARMYYLTSYLTKPSMSMHVGLFALSYAISRIEKRLFDDGVAAFGLSDERIASAMTTAVNSMMGHQEISHPQVMSYLVGGGDHYSSEKFQAFNWGSILGYVSLYWNSVDSEVPSSDRTEDNVSLSMKRGELMISSQRLDYMLRSTHDPYNALCVYDFFAMVRKQTIGLVSNGYPLDSAGQNPLGGAHSLGVDCARFSSPDHPQFRTHCLKFRRRPCIPVLLGPSVLRKGLNTDSERRAMQILTLFKPWREARDLKSVAQTWCDALAEYTPVFSMQHAALVDHLDILAESKEERDKSMNRRRQNKRRRVTAPPGMTIAGLISDIADTGRSDTDSIVLAGSVFNTLLHTSFTPDAVYSDGSIRRLVELIGPLCAATLNHCYPVSLLTASSMDLDGGDVCSPHEYVGVPMDVDDTDSHIRHVAGMRLNHISTNALDDAQEVHPGDTLRAGGSLNPTVLIGRLADEGANGNLVDVPLDIRSADSPLDWRWSCLARVISDKMLYTNPEQLRAFLIIARHIIEGGRQLLMYVGGMGGTGKSHVVESIVLLLSLLDRRKELLIGAPTGIAAVLIGGATLHSLILANTTKRQSVSQKLTDIWRHVRYLIIDEISMVGASFFAMLSNRICIAKGDDPLNGSRLFGGVSVIALGDFCQLKPVNQHSLFSSALISRPSFEQVRDNIALDAMSGVYIWREFRTVVQLMQNQRQINDPVYASVLSNIRLKHWMSPIDGTVWTETQYIDYLQSRLLSRVARDDHQELAMFSDAPVIVGHRMLRDALNVKLLQYHSRQANERVHLYYAHDTVSGQPSEGRIKEVLWGLPSTKCNDMLGVLPLFVGMRVMIMENIAISNGIVNGAEGTVCDVKYHLNSENERVADAVYVRVPGSQIAVPGLDPDVVVIAPVAISVPFNFSVYSPHISVQSFRRRQIPIIPAYSYTDYKSQGRSLERCIVDLATAHGQGVYVMLSRVKSLRGLLILRWFPPTQIFQRPLEELRTELSRLDALDVATLSVFNAPSTFHDRMAYIMSAVRQAGTATNLGDDTVAK